LFPNVDERLALTERIYTETSQLAADVRRLASMQVVASTYQDWRIGAPDYLDLTSDPADLSQMQDQLDNGACIIIEIGKARPRACYWLVGVDVTNDTATIKSARIGIVTSEKVSIIKAAGLNITGRYLLSKYGA
jgi:hypothetical protein